MTDRLAEIEDHGLEPSGVISSADFYWLIAKVKRLKAVVGACHEAIGEAAESDDDGLAEGIKLNITERDAEIERLEDSVAELIETNNRLYATRDSIRAEGMEAAAVIAEPMYDGKDAAIAIRTAAKDKPEADANNADFRDGGYAKDTT